MKSQPRMEQEVQRWYERRGASSARKKNSLKPLVCFEDEHIAVISKPSGLLTLPDRFHSTLPNVRDMLAQRYGEIFIVHRIDRDTSGIMLVCKTADAHRIMSEQFEARSVRKVYHALVRGRMEDDEMHIDIPLMPDPKRPGLMIPSVRGKESLTRVRVLRRFRFATLLECELITGRQHQIRAHCSAVGYPLLVDKEYGGAEAFFLSSIKRGYHQPQDTGEKPIISRTSLHSFSIEFHHPHTQAVMYFDASYPKDFKAVLQTLDKYAPYREFGAVHGIGIRAIRGDATHIE
ncbi:MAG: RluA family pseudouridine synthase [Bacteroidota bacterium]|nr:RluA family pseudouridine synthase [Candidatus Kapabacteria bacterium]MDW8220059.1 RluA family pseudouridine synthase [Bacteroidota bacterium]